MERMNLRLVCFFCAALGCGALVSCAGQRQGVVCEEIEYRYNSMSYSPDQRVFMEEELRACREEEAKKKQASAETRQSIYARFAAQDTTKKVHTSADTVPAEDPQDISVSELMQDTSSNSSPSIYERFGADSSAAIPADSAAVAADSTVLDSATTESTVTEEVVR